MRISRLGLGTRYDLDNKFIIEFKRQLSETSSDTEGLECFVEAFELFIRYPLQNKTLKESSFGIRNLECIAAAMGGEISASQYCFQIGFDLSGCNPYTALNFTIEILEKTMEDGKPLITEAEAEDIREHQRLYETPYPDARRVYVPEFVRFTPKKVIFGITPKFLKEKGVVQLKLHSKTKSTETIQRATSRVTGLTKPLNQNNDYTTDLSWELAHSVFSPRFPENFIILQHFIDRLYERSLLKANEARDMKDHFQTCHQRLVNRTKPHMGPARRGPTLAL